MAILIPSLNAAKSARQKPTEGEIFLLEFLESNFDDKTEVYFQPCFNGDRPDIVLISPSAGIIIIEVKDWNLDLYRVSESNEWFVDTGSRSQRIKSPFAQVFSYKKNFFDIHVNGLLERSLKDSKFFRLVSTYVYFHRGSKADLERLYKGITEKQRNLSLENDAKFRNGRIDFNCYQSIRDAVGRAKYRLKRDSELFICKESLSKIRFPVHGDSNVFEESVYSEIKRLLIPPYHYASEGRALAYTDKQRSLIESSPKARVKICGLAGSGKTVVLAGRAVSAHKRHGGRVLVLTYNITLRSYIHDKISTIRENFPWSAFEISNYHHFIASALNNAGIEVTVPKELNYDGSDRELARTTSVLRDQYFERNYYSNISIFSGREIKARYATILIDEVQDYRPEWIKMIRSHFLEEGGEMLLFGDEKQNIYERALDEERRSRVVEGFGRWVKLTKSFRYTTGSPIVQLIDSFQRRFLVEVYEIDSDESFQLGLGGIGVQAWGVFDKSDPGRLAEKIIGIARRNKVHPNDISIISSHEQVLRSLDYVLRSSPAHKERTLCTFPSLEVTQHPKYSKSYGRISKGKKIGFNLNSGVMKLSSTHSFKGFESRLVVLLIDNDDSPEMVFTGLSRAKEDVLVFLEEGSSYLDFFKEHLGKEGV